MMSRREQELEELRGILANTELVYNASVKRCVTAVEEHEAFLRKEHEYQYKLLEMIAKIREDIKKTL